MIGQQANCVNNHIVRLVRMTKETTGKRVTPRPRLTFLSCTRVSRLGSTDFVAVGTARSATISISLNDHVELHRFTNTDS